MSGLIQWFHLRVRLIDLFLPSQCVLCNIPPKPLCDECLVALDIKTLQLRRADLHGVAILTWSKNVSKLLVAFKEHGVTHLATQLSDLLARAVAKPDVDYLLASPSSKHSFARRGFAPAAVIAKRLGRRWGIPTVSARLVRAVSDQARLGAELRATNLIDAYRVPSIISGKRVLLIDDIATTGSTLTELARAARQAGAKVAGFAVLAGAELHSRP